MPTFLRHKLRVHPKVTASPGFREELWDSGGRPVRNGNYTGGGFFRVYRSGSKWNGIRVTIGVPNVPAWQYNDAPLHASIPDRYQFPELSLGPPNIFDYNVDQFGAEAWNQMRPDKPSFSLLNAVYELKDIPQILKPRILKYRDSKAWADYYLAIQFGWLPLLRDVRDFVSSTFDLDRRIKQLIRDEGKPVRRKVNLGNRSWKATGYNNGKHAGAWHESFVTGVYVGTPIFEDRLESGVETWAVGQFRYHLPSGPRDMRWRADMMARIFDLYPSPAVVWRAIPWSWLTDWFGNVGDVLENMSSSAAERLAADYAFLMMRRYQIITRLTSGTFRTKSGGTVSVSDSTSLISEAKYRTIIDPFGPSVSWPNLTATQYSIIGALGMSRFPSYTGRY